MTSTREIRPLRLLGIIAALCFFAYLAGGATATAKAPAAPTVAACTSR
ncbi:hypothetical protein [Actinocrispum sp. NPDC049592]